jgi:cardiolipin synthase
MPLLRKLRKKHLHRTRRFFARFRRSTQAEFTPGNRLTLLHTGSEFFADLFANLDGAVSFICLEFYIVHDDRTGRQLAQILLRAVQRGVKVYLLYDYIGSFETPSGFFRSLEKGGVRCVPFNPPPFRKGITWFDKRDHRKIAVIDGEIAYAGGLNIGDEYAGIGGSTPHWRDLGIRLEGPSVSELLHLFAENWHEEEGVPPEGTAVPIAVPQGDDAVAIVSGGPHHNRSRIRAAFRMGIAGATESIRIQTPYFVPGPRFIRALFRAVRRGVLVQLILPAHSDVPLVRLINRSYYGALIKGGIEVYEREETILHAKIMIIDSSWSVIGSANLDQRSFHRNYEVNVIAASLGFGQQVEQLFAADLACSRPIDLAEYEGRSLLVRLLERLTAPLSWFL